jgi:hypothetical protein
MEPLRATVLVSLSRKQMGQEQSLVVMHPGWCQTEMGGPQANLSAE